MHRLIHCKMARLIGDSTIVKTLKNAIRKDLRERWDLMQANVEDEMVLSVYLDPRLKSFDFVSTTTEIVRLIQKARSLLKDFLEEDAESQHSSQNNARSTGSSLQTRYSEMFGSMTLYSANQVTLEQELDAYHRKSACPLVGDQSDPLLWWKKKQNKFPRISRLARKILTLTATSVPSERVFSKSGWIVNKRRSSLSDKNVSLLVFLSCNQHHQR
jgi:hypothetical protein